ncbi:hypothetical protein LTR65_003671 [Meristemomyces frigidus]
MASSQHFIAFLGLFSTTIKSLTLEEAMIPHTECWSTVFRWILDNLDLTTIDVEDLVRDNHDRDDGTDQTFLMDAGEMIKVKVEGVAAIKERLLAAATQAVFLNRCFRERSHIFTNDGLQSLVDITNTPHLARNVQHIRIVVATLCSQYDPDERYFPVMLRGRQQDDLDKYQHEFEQRQNLAWERSITATHEMRSGSEARDLLTLALGNLATYGTSLKISVSGHMRDDINCPPYGAASFRRRLGNMVEPEDLRPADFSKAVESVVEAMQATRSKVETLSLTDGVVTSILGPASILTAAQLGDRDLPHCLHMRHLQLNLQTAGRWREETEWRGFDAWIAAMVSLESLDICWGDACTELEHQRLVLPRIGWAIRNCTLRSISVSWTKATLADYRRFLDSQSHCLRSLTMKWTGTSWNECWSSLLGWMAEHLELSMVDLCCLETAAPAGSRVYAFGENGEDTSVTFSGQVAVKEGLRTAARRPAYICSDVDGDEWSLSAIAPPDSTV